MILSTEHAMTDSTENALTDSTAKATLLISGKIGERMEKIKHTKKQNTQSYNCISYTAKRQMS